LHILQLAEGDGAELADEVVAWVELFHVLLHAIVEEVRLRASSGGRSSCLFTAFFGRLAIPLSHQHGLARHARVALDVGFLCWFCCILPFHRRL